MEDQIHANKLLLLGKLTASLVHEIRNPLSAIKLNLDYMKMAEEELPSDINEIITESLEAFDQVNFLIEDVLDFTRKPTEKVHSISLETVTDRCLKIITTSARRKGINIEKEFPKDLPNIFANRNKITQIFLNLLNNSIDASHEKSIISIKSYEQIIDDCKFVVWAVEDFGCGINPENVDRINQGFFTTKSNGHGIGLGVCKKLADETNAELNFKSELGKGTTFFVKFKLNQ